jgi:RsiW-degrading membrane proteinase PrsW (M82 family)
MNLTPMLYALLGGILPALLWLFFWLREDRRSPEPHRLILKTFLCGMLAVLIVIPLQKEVEHFFPAFLLLHILLWATLEEVTKFFAGYFGGLHSIEDNEPVDPLIYMITAALGFVAMENTLFILNPLLGHDVVQSVITGNLRFIGASLLHVVSSGLVGAALSASFYKLKGRRLKVILTGLGGAILFHTGFNALILLFAEKGLVAAFIAVWLGVIWLLWAFEKSKAVAP